VLAPPAVGNDAVRRRVEITDSVGSGQWAWMLYIYTVSADSGEVQWAGGAGDGLKNKRLLKY
jgi:hypothetical protein